VPLIDQNFAHVWKPMLHMSAAGRRGEEVRVTEPEKSRMQDQSFSFALLGKQQPRAPDMGARLTHSMFVSLFPNWLGQTNLGSTRSGATRFTRAPLR
jgi:hypothetical protein